MGAAHASSYRPRRMGWARFSPFPSQPGRVQLVAYGPDYLHMYRRAPFYVDRILKGAKPADLSVEQPTRIELLVNLQVAKALGIEVPLSLLVRADDLLE